MCTVVRATGHIRNYQLVISCVMFLNIVVSYIFLKNGFSPLVVLEIKCCLDLVYLLVRLMFMKKMVGFSILLYTKKVLSPVSIITIISILYMLLITMFFSNGWMKLFFSCILFYIAFIPLAVFLGLNTSERVAIKVAISNKCHKN